MASSNKKFEHFQFPGPVNSVNMTYHDEITYALISYCKALGLQAKIKVMLTELVCYTIFQ